jgi:hypothetical protein
MQEPELEEAVAALDVELGSRKPRPKGRGPRPAYKRVWVDWQVVADWLYDHPHRVFRADPVHAQAIYRFRKRFPDIHVVGSYHRQEEGTGRRIARMWACFEPDDDTWTDA